MMIIAHTNMNSRDESRDECERPNHRPTGIEQRDGGQQYGAVSSRRVRGTPPRD